MSYFMKKKWKNQISQVLLIVILATLFVPILPTLNGLEDNRAVAAEVYSSADLAEKAVYNNKTLYENGQTLGAYDFYILKEANIDVTSWVYDGKKLEDVIIDLADKTTKNDNAKKIAYEYLAMKKINKEETNGLSNNLLSLLKNKQTQEGGFVTGDYSEYTNMPAFEALAREKAMNEINTENAINYILKQQNKTSGAWPSAFADFQTTAQAIRSLIELKEYAVDKNKVQAAIDNGIEWIKSKQQNDGSFKNEDWDDPVVDTSEVIYILKSLKQDLNNWKKNGKGPVDYMKTHALNEDGSFGTSKNIMDNTYALDAYHMLDGTIDMRVSELATKAAQNNLNAYKTGTNLGAYDFYILKEANVDVTSWVYDGKKLEDVIIDSAHKTTSDDNAKKIAYGYLAMKKINKEEANGLSNNLLSLLKNKQTQEGGFVTGDYSEYTNMPAFEALAREKAMKEINTENAVNYILKQQNKTSGAWPSAFADFQTTAQAIRSLIELKEYAVDKNKVQVAIDKGIEWIKSKQQNDGSFKNEDWDDPVVDTSEVIYILKSLKQDLNSWTNNGKGPVDYMKTNALNEDGSFGTSKNIMDNTYVLDAYVMLGGIVHIKDDGNNTGGGTEVEGNKVFVSIKGYNGMVLSKTEVELKNNDTVFTMTKRVLDNRGISYKIEDGDYFLSIDGQAHKDKGTKSGWLFNVNGTTTDSGADSKKLYGGEEIEWFYTLDFTTDSRNTNNMNGEIKDELDKQIDEAKNVLNNENATESEVTKAVKDITDQLNKQADEIKSQEDAKNFVKDTKDIAAVMDQAVERIKTEDGAKDLANESINVVKALAKTTEKLKEDSDKKDIDEAAAENMKTILKIMDKIKDVEEMNKVATDMLNAAGTLMKEIGKDNSEGIKEKAVEIVEKAVNLAGQQTFEKNQLKTDKDKVVATVDARKMKDLSKNLAKIAKEMKESLNKNDLEHQFEKKLTIAVADATNKEVEVNLPSDMMKTIKENGIDKVQVKTQTAVFNVTPNTFGEKAEGKEIALSAKKVDRNELSAIARNKIPEDSVVVDLDAKLGQEKISNFEEPIGITIPYEGTIEEGKEVKVFFLNDNGTIEEMGGKYDSVTKTITFTTSHFSKYFAKKVDKEMTKTFTDLQDYEWAKEAVEDMAGKGIISGRKSGIFDPSANITRAEFATLITKMLAYKGEKEIPFKDVDKEKWYYDAVTAAYENGLINGRSETVFDPEGKITRQEIAVIISKVLEKKGYEKAPTEQLNTFKDKENIAPWARNGVSLCVKTSIVSGMGEGNFTPTQNANRAQAVVMLYKLHQLIQE